MKNILEWLEMTAEKFSDKQAFSDQEKSLTFGELQSMAQKTGSALHTYGRKRAVLVLIDKSCDCIVAMMGALYAGDFYVAADVHSPADRIQAIVDTLDAPIIITDEKNKALALSLERSDRILFIEALLQSPIDQGVLDQIRHNMIDLDPAYILFTSGSTGVPKGTVVSHRSLMAYINWVSCEFAFDGHTIFASQTPLYFSMSVTDLYSTIKCGCTFHIIPKEHFMFPLNLVAFLNEKKVNTIYWVPTALSILANWKTFEVAKPAYLQKILFAGEVMPVKQLNYWIAHFPDATFANLFGPTETTDICTFYVVDRDFADDENLPIGKHCDNCHVFILKEDGTEAKIGEEGELYARTSFVANGYYNNPGKTAEVFVQNPLNHAYPEIVYRTGDIVKMNEAGEILYLSRKDFQIKRSGYRIELGEIEAAGNSVDRVKGCVCVYSKEKDCLALIYEGGPKDIEIVREVIKNKVPYYMVPDQIIRVKNLPLNANGKIDRKLLIANLNNEMEERHG